MGAGPRPATQLSGPRRGRAGGRGGPAPGAWPGHVVRNRRGGCGRVSGLSPAGKGRPRRGVPGVGGGGLRPSRRPGAAPRLGASGSRTRQAGAAQAGPAKDEASRGPARESPAPGGSAPPGPRGRRGREIRVTRLEEAPRAVREAGSTRRARPGILPGQARGKPGPGAGSWAGVLTQAGSEVASSRPQGRRR